MKKKPKPDRNLLQTRVSDVLFKFVKDQARSFEMTDASWLRLKLVEMHRAWLGQDGK